MWEVRLKKLQLLLILFILTCYASIGIYVARISHMHTQKIEQQIRDDVQDARIEALEKEIRVLKTDLYFLQNGYEEISK